MKERQANEKAFDQVIFFSDVQGMRSLLERGGLPVGQVNGMPSQYMSFKETTLHVVVFLKPSTEMLKFMRERAEKELSNFLVLCSRPGTTFTATLEETGDKLLLLEASHGSLFARTKEQLYRNGIFKNHRGK